MCNLRRKDLFLVFPFALHWTLGLFNDKDIPSRQLQTCCDGSKSQEFKTKTVFYVIQWGNCSSK